MTIRFDIPTNIEQLLAEQGADPHQAAKEAALVELYRQERIDHSEFAAALGTSRYEADGVLKRHGVLSSITAAEVQADAEALLKLVKR